ncbi:hypothetical protein [Gelidibacter salicanalis]|uniref:Uncharacterized protein n=1 Tax=Gelidibacter salicanalis TaxID=291193 RepID=A0A934KT74_9FLAO|nr:hypothetical protein [Gelidibacter salicanalis]MBJ7881600.1 hypothetical protein [Gelidibacter salicanalis]
MGNWNNKMSTVDRELAQEIVHYEASKYKRWFTKQLKLMRISSKKADAVLKTLLFFGGSQ